MDTVACLYLQKDDSLLCFVVDIDGKVRVKAVQFQLLSPHTATFDDNDDDGNNINDDGINKVN